MKYLSVCSGIEAATCAWHPLGWEPQAFSEIEKFPSEVLAHHYPHVPNLGDMTNYKRWDIGNIDMLVGGTPCQSFSVAGLRNGLDDPRGNLALVYLGIAERFHPRWILWENVPGVLSSFTGPKPPSDLEEGQEWETTETSDFECFTAALVQLGYRFAFRVLDAQYFGVPQRRRRVFVVGYLGDWRRAAAVLFERYCLRGHPTPSRETGKDTPPFTSGSIGGYDQKLGTLRASGGDLGVRSENLVMAHGQANAEIVSDGSPSLTCNHEAPILAHSIITANTNSNGLGVSEEIAPTLDQASPAAVAFSQNQQGEVRESDIIPSLTSGRGKPGQGYPAVRQCTRVRRLTPVECERLQGFPDNYTQIPWRNKPAEDCPLGHRYKALGNSMAVPVMHWLGKRIKMVDAL